MYILCSIYSETYLERPLPWKTTCLEGPPILRRTWSYIFSVNEPVTKDHLSWETTYLWPMGWSFKQVLLYFYMCVNVWVYFQVRTNKTYTVTSGWSCYPVTVLVGQWSPTRWHQMPRMTGLGHPLLHRSHRSVSPRAPSLRQPPTAGTENPRVRSALQTLPKAATSWRLTAR